ncbi:MAG: tRNA (adenosine(37)-N6)-threonylcarbamoyltransferase complex transferase subunit TsaD [Desulfomonile tiedjei]|uniref:tRNA N6-adenosine threonylcarbamoyltransferase n=1 Tax=Desulfomonile tiedjei TaxID=2358 RepID=A0A9D6Z626_9BACT|nr:tRNA (adenosine(37)-N6)-threonylcarbamoyltransferase complex transferase subunit TsaD [Desulfomonile tiedjei]
MLVLGIETSCDETAAAVIEDGRRILSDVVLSQIDVHKEYGGVVPELASRKHVEAISFVIREALSGAGVEPEQLGGIGVTRGPGLIGSLLVGISAAKGMALALGKPLCGVNHLHGHLFAVFLERDDIHFPFVGLVVSGGHTSLYHVESPMEIQLIGRTRDDAAGEAFDKVAKLLGLGYPGGVVIERHAKGVDPGDLRFPRALMEKDSLDFSFSGLKTAVLRQAEEFFGRSRLNDAPGSFHALSIPSAGECVHEGVKLISAAFQDAVTDVLTTKGLRAAEMHKSEKLIVCGGVAANTALRERMIEEGLRKGIEAVFPAISLCTDNGAMIAARAEHLLSAGLSDDLNFSAKSRW